MRSWAAAGLDGGRFLGSCPVYPFGPQVRRWTLQRPVDPSDLLNKLRSAERSIAPAPIVHIRYINAMRVNIRYKVYPNGWDAFRAIRPGTFRRVFATWARDASARSRERVPTTCDGGSRPSVKRPERVAPPIGPASTPVVGVLRPRAGPAPQGFQSIAGTRFASLRLRVAAATCSCSYSAAQSDSGSSI